MEPCTPAGRFHGGLRRRAGPGDPARLPARPGLRVAAGRAAIMCAPSRNGAQYQKFLQRAEDANPETTVYVVTGNLSGHDSKHSGLAGRSSRIRYAFIPKGACRLNSQEPWWRIFRRQALAGQDFVGPGEIAHATRVATA